MEEGKAKKAKQSMSIHFDRFQAKVAYKKMVPIKLNIFATSCSFCVIHNAACIINHDSRNASSAPMWVGRIK